MEAALVEEIWKQCARCEGWKLKREFPPSEWAKQHRGWCCDCRRAYKREKRRKDRGLPPDATKMQVKYGMDYSPPVKPEREIDPLWIDGVKPGKNTYCLLEKRCSKCGKIKPINEYTINRAHYDEREVHCGDCYRREQAEVKRLSRLSNPERWARARDSYAQLRHERVAAASDGSVTRAEIVRLFGSADRCPYCGKKISGDWLEMAPDHMDPIARGGAHSIRNIVICCKKCNTRKQARSFDEWVGMLDEKHRDRARQIYWERKSMLPLAM